MYTKVNGEQQVQILSPNFSISPSNEDYVLNISANGRDFSPLFAVSAGVTRLVSNVAPGSYYKLVGNQSEVVINWQRMCATEGSSFDPSVLDPYWTSAETKTYVDSAVTDTQNQLNEISGMMQSKELVISTAFNQLSDDIAELSAATPSTEEIELPIAAAVNDLKGNIEARLNQKYYTKQEVNDIAARKVEAGQVDAQIKDYVDPAIEEVNDTIEDKELATSAAINDLNTATVKSTAVKNIWSGTQSEYDAIVEKDPATLYIIKD